MNYIQWNYEDDLLAGTTLRDPSLPENNNMALHACLRKEDVLNNRDTCLLYTSHNLKVILIS